MEFLKEYVYSYLIEIVILVFLYLTLVFLFKKFNYKISKEKTASLVVLLFVLYFIVSILLGIFCHINISRIILFNLSSTL